MKQNLKYFIHKAIWILLFYVSPFVLAFYLFQILLPKSIFYIILFLFVWILSCIIIYSLTNLLINKLRSKWEVIDNHFSFIEKEDKKY